MQFRGRVRAVGAAVIAVALTWGCAEESQLIGPLGRDGTVPDAVSPDAGAPVDPGPGWPLTVAGASPASLAVADERGMLVAGSFTGRVTFGSRVLMAASDGPAGFVARVDRRGEISWASAATGNLTISDLVVDRDGFSYVAGRFKARPQCWRVARPTYRLPGRGDGLVERRAVARACGMGAKATFGPRTISAPWHGLFVAKLDPAGRFVWVAPAPFDERGPTARPGPSARRIGDRIEDRIGGVGAPPAHNLPEVAPRGIFGGKLAVDGDGNILLAGSVHGPATFGTFATPLNVRAVFVTKLDPAGRFQWLALAPQRADQPANRVAAIAATESGHAMVVGTMASETDFGRVPGDGTRLSRRAGAPVGSTDVFVARVERDGSFRWASAGWIEGGSLAAADVALDRAGNGIVAGHATVEVPGRATLGARRSEPVGNAGFVAKVDKDGRFEWSVWSGGATVRPMALTIDNEGDVLVTGAIPRPEQIAAVSFGPTDLLLDERAAFLARVIPTGEMIWATVAYGASWGSAVLTDSQGDIFVAGRIDQPATFDGVTVTPGGRSELFVWKLAKP